jgi:hypothetical protein
MNKQALLDLADALERCEPPYRLTADNAAAALREYAATMEQEQKARPNFLAGYDAGMKDMAHRIDALEAEKPMQEPVARLLHWVGPKPIPHGGIAARTFLEFPADTPTDDRYWMEGEPLYTHPPAPQRTPLNWPIRGVRVDDDKVVITVKGGNDAARWLCGELLSHRDSQQQESQSE